MKKVLILLVLIVAIFFGVRMWKKKKGPQTAAAVPAVVATPVATTSAPPPPKKEIKEEEKPKPASVQVDTSAQVIVFCYHRMESKVGGDLSIEPALFEQHMQTLKDNGITVISMQDFLAWKRNEKSIPAKSAIITIDDGYVSAYDVARPILKKFGYPWTYFVYTSYVGTGGKSVTWKQLEELRDEGVEIGSHTVSHQDLRSLPHLKGKAAPGKEVPADYESWLRNEVLGSKKIIEQKLGIECATFAYPFGYHNPKVVGLVKEAGYAAAFSVYGQRNTHEGSNQLVGRYAYSAKRPQDMKLAFEFAGPASVAAEDAPDASIPAGAMMVTQPMEGDVVTDPQPVIKANLSTLGAIDPKSITIRLSGTGLLTTSYDEETKTVQAKPAKPLKAGDYTVILNGRADNKKLETQWHFKVEPKPGN